MRKKILSLALFVGAMLLLTATGVLAASPVTSNSHPVGEEAGSIPTISPTVSITNPVATAIANFFSSVVFTPTYTVTVQSVLDLHASGLGYGEIAKALFLCQSGASTMEEILGFRQAGLGWGEIAKELGLTPGNRGRNLGAIMSGRGVVTPTETVTGTMTRGAEVGAKGERGRPETPPGWERGRGHNK